MDISGQNATFGGFIRVTLWSTALTTIGVLFLTLLFATSWNWFQSLMVTVVVGVAGGLMLRLSAAWYLVLFLLSGGVAVTVGIVSLLTALAS